MRKLLFLTLIMFVTLTVQAQIVDSLPPTTIPTHALDPFSFAGRFRDTLHRDTLSENYDGEEWNGIYRTSWSDNLNQPVGPVRKIGLVREEDRKVYYVDLQNFPRPRIGLIYDYSLEVSDTVTILASQIVLAEDPEYRLAEVTKVDYVDCAFGNNVKRLEIVTYDDWPNDSVSLFYIFCWYEGVGDIYHPYVPSVCVESAQPCESDGYNAFRSEGIWYKKREWNCQRTTSTNPFGDPVTKVSYYPNPLSTDRTLNLSAPAGTTITQLNLYDSAGRLRLRQTDNILGLQSVELGRLNLPSGMYYGVAQLRSGKSEVLRIVLR